MDEFFIISKYISPLASREKGAFNLTDDAAIIPLPSVGYQHIVTNDTILERTHFLYNTNPRDLAHKILGINLSDIASMGAVPKYYFMSAIFNSTCNEEWIKNFTDELSILQKQYDITLMGGDTVFHNGDITLSVTMIGEVEHDKCLLRSGANIGDNIYVTETIGDSALGLYLLQNSEIKKEISENVDYLINRYLRPQPRVDISLIIKKFASSATDISDGLIADMENICKSSGVGAEIFADMIPISSKANIILNMDNNLIELIYSGGDDYELLFTVSDEFETDMLENIAKNSISITKIGKIINGNKKGNKCFLLDKNGKEIQLSKKGYVHNIV